jgi:hypothetical protein
VRRQLLAHVLDLPGFDLQRGGDGGDNELISRHARRLEHLADRQRQATHDAADQLLQAARNPIRRRIDRSVDVPPAITPYEQPRGDEVVHHVDHEQGVSLGSFVDARREPPQGARWRSAKRRSAEARLDVCRHVVARQQLERDLLAQPLRL